jgi:transglutaminase-like putative cysteine protease
VDNIDVNYNYVDPLITVLFPLFGTNILDNYMDFTITNRNAQPVRVMTETEIPGYSDKATDTVDIPANGTVDVTENPRLTQASIDSLDIERPASLHVRVVYLQNGDEKLILDETKNITLTARRDFPWTITGFTQQEDFQLLAAMITPTDPSVEALIRDAANHTSNGTMVGGYEGDTLDSKGLLWERLSALWDAENDYKLTYVNTTVTFAPGTYQRIRLPSEVLAQQSGNCIETSDLFASAAEALQLQTAIIIIPGHAYMAVRMDDTNSQYYVIETTFIGRYSFADAVTKGAQELQDALPHINANEDNYAWVDIPTARTAGINPLPWH